MIAYASRTGTRRNLAALRAAGWRLLVSATGVWRTEGFDRYALDNGAWTAYQQRRPFDGDRFLRLVDALGEGADWIVIPDIVAGGAASLEFSAQWLGRLRGISAPLLLAVQDGMQPEQIRPWLSPGVGLFVGGTSEWKEATAAQWGRLAQDAGVWCHLGRVNTGRRMRIAASAGMTSVDGTSASRYAETLPLLDWHRRQADLLAPEAA